MPRNTQTILRELLVLRCQRGEREALAALAQEWQGRLFYYIRRLVESEEDAWDVLQQTWLQAFKGIGSLRDADRLPAWLYRIARCQAASRWRDHYRSAMTIDDAAVLDEVQSPEPDEPWGDTADLHRALEQISLPHREVLTLFFLEDLSLPEPAAARTAAQGCGACGSCSAPSV